MAQVQMIKRLIQATVANATTFERVLSKVEVLSAGQGWCNYGMKVEQEHLNSGLVAVHGGLIATIVDSMSTYTLMTVPPHKPGVSVNLHIEYLKAAKPGDEIIIETKISKTGRTLAFLDVAIKNKENDKLLYRGTHVKHLGP